MTRQSSIVIRLAWGIALGSLLLALGTGVALYIGVRETLQVSARQELLSAAEHVHHRLAEEGHVLNKEVLEVGDHLQVRAVDKRGVLRLESTGMGQKVPLELYPVPGEVGQVVSGRESLGHRFKAIVVDTPEAWIQVVRFTESERALLNDFRHFLYIAMGLVPLLSWAMGFWLARRGFAPVKRLVAALGSIRPDTLGSRVDVAGLGRELVPLALSLNEALTRLEGAFSRLADLNADLAHELRTPLHLIRLEAEELLSSGDLPAARRETAENLLASTDHLSAVVSQMLFLARTEDPAGKLERSAVDLGGLLARVAEDFEPLAEEQEISLVLEVPDARMEILLDPVLVRRALHNVVANAIRHSPPKSVVTLRLMLGEGKLTVEVEDRGDGIPPELLPRLGRRFVRGDASRARHTGGTGLGLAIVHGIMQLHGGRLGFDSALGRGTRVELCFPST